MKLETDIPTFLKQCVKLFRKDHHWRRLPVGIYYFGPMDFILHHGRHWLPADFPLGRYRLGVPDEPYRNAVTLAFEHAELTYCEGYATSLLPAAHAWCVDAKGRVVDNTWSDRAGSEYFGVPFNIEFLRNEVQRNERYSMIESYERRFPLLRIPPSRAQRFLHLPVTRLPEPSRKQVASASL